MSKLYVTYLRLSKKKKAKDGQEQPDYYGIEAQRKTISAEIAMQGGVMLHEYIEIESGTRAKLYRRTEILKAIRHCKDTGATLIVAKLDRLARDSEFIMKVMNSGIDVFFCDFKFEGLAGRMMLQVLSAFAEYEAKRIQQRTIEGLAIARSRGKVLGNRRFGTDIAKIGAAASAQVRRMNLHETANVKVKGQIEIYRYRDKMTIEQIADKLNNDGQRTTYDKRFTPQTVQRILKLKFQPA